MLLSIQSNAATQSNQPAFRNVKEKSISLAKRFAQTVNYPISAIDVNFSNARLNSTRKASQAIKNKFIADWLPMKSEK